MERQPPLIAPAGLASTGPVARSRTVPCGTVETRKWLIYPSVAGFRTEVKLNPGEKGSEVRGQRSEVRGQRSEVRGQRSESPCSRYGVVCPAFALLASGCPPPTSA